MLPVTAVPQCLTRPASIEKTSPEMILLPTLPRYPTATLLPDQRILIMGGTPDGLNGTSIVNQNYEIWVSSWGLTPREGIDGMRPSWDCFCLGSSTWEDISISMRPELQNTSHTEIKIKTGSKFRSLTPCPFVSIRTQLTPWLPASSSPSDPTT